MSVSTRFKGLMLSLVLLLPTHPAIANTQNVTIVDAEQVFELASQHVDLVILDVRLSFDYSRAHIPGAVNLPSREATSMRLADIIGHKSTPTLIYCNGERCDRSRQVVSKAASLGYTNLYWFQGGMIAWSRQMYVFE